MTQIIATPSAQYVLHALSIIAESTQGSTRQHAEHTLYTYPNGTKLVVARNNYARGAAVLAVTPKGERYSITGSKRLSDRELYAMAQEAHRYVTHFKLAEGNGAVKVEIDAKTSTALKLLFSIPALVVMDELTKLYGQEKAAEVISLSSQFHTMLNFQPSEA